MDYEKKYKEALEKAKEVYNRKDATDGGKLILESMFPELKESEDVKMREMAIKAIYAPEAQSCIKSWGINPDDVIAWLEKQGEKESDPRYENLEEILAADDIYQMSMNDEMVQEAKEKAVNALSGMCIGRLLGLEKQYVHKPIISNNALREGIAHFGITQYQIDNWLKKYVDVEKQSEQKPAPKFNVGDTMRTLQEAADGYTDGMPVVVSIDNEYYHCTNELISIKDQDDYEFPPMNMKQKPADKVEPKFKVGDWCIDNEDNTIFQITKVLSNLYYYRTNEGKEYACTRDSIERDAHLWTIQDAKDGDVLVDKYAIIIFRKIGNHVFDDVVDFHIRYSFEMGIIVQRHNLHCGFIDSVFFKPATKEQRDMFFQKIHEEGYEWDFKVKELNKIEKKPACSEEEKQLLLKDLCARLPYGVKAKITVGV